MLRVLSILLVVAATILFSTGGGRASVKNVNDYIPDSYLSENFNWTLVLDLPDVHHYLNYPKSKLWPLTEVHANLRSYDRDDVDCVTTYYEDLWYHNETPVGLRRHNQITINRNSGGALIVCPADENADFPRRASAIANAIVRLNMDVQLRNASISLVLVPDNEYEGVSDALTSYKMSSSTNPAFSPVSFHMRAYPEGEEDHYFYLRN
jgi:hypothetical protein